MKNTYLLAVIFLGFFLLAGCKSKEEKEAQKAKDLISARTLGLAYLEEFKLEEAEKEFLRFIELAPKEKLGYANLGLTYLRMGKYPEAEKQLLKGIDIDPKDPDIRLIMATVYKMQDNMQGAVNQLQEALKSTPGHIKVLYELTELYSGGSDNESKASRETCLRQLAEIAPGNLVPKLNLTDLYIRKGAFDQAVEQLEVIQKQFPDFPKEAVEYFNETVTLLKKGDQGNAVVQFTIFHNYLKVSSPYQAGMLELKGPGGSLIGFPLITFNQQAPQGNLDESAILEAIRFTDITTTTGLDLIRLHTGDAGNTVMNSTHIAACDYDGDGDIDLYTGNYDEASATFKHYLLSNEMGRFSDITQSSGLNHTGREYAATFADYDNDGFFDLYINKEDGGILYRNAGKGVFEDVTKKSGLKGNQQVIKSLFFDADHDGDLDLLELRTGQNMLFRNNADGTFTDNSEKAGVAGNKVASSDAVFGDFNEDGVIDLIVANENGLNSYYSNQRQGMFKDVIGNSGISNTGTGQIETGDYNNDGFLDLFIAPVEREIPVFYRNSHDGKFEQDVKAGEIFDVLKGVRVHDARFLDFDNDGFLDLLIAGEPSEEGARGLYLLHNNGNGGFTDASNKLPETVKSGKQLCVFDYNDDGDLDILVAGIHGGAMLLRNDGGNANHFIKIKLVGLKAGSAKNNHFGIGAKVEVRSGELYQTLVVTDPNVYFGLGNRQQADIVRITWTNGVPQNIFMPTSNQSLVESQTLKGSCPFLYAWDGEKYEFVKDILWRSALGMPMGIMGGNTTYAFADASDDYLKIPGAAVKPRKGKYSFQMTSELWETIYYDEIELVAVDHPENTDIFVPEQFTPPPFPGNKVYHVSEKSLPVRATDAKGNDVLAAVSKKDDVFLGGFKPGKYQGIVEMTELILDPGESGNDGNLHLFLTGWIFPTDASINVALSQTEQLKVVSPRIQVINKKGEWETVMDNLGFPMGKDKTVIADLSGKFLSADHRIRIVTNMEIYWDYIFFSDKVTMSPVKSTSLHPSSADLHYRGFSRLYRKGGRYGPHWFDYSVVDKEPKWRDLTGNYTRFGDVLPLLLNADNQYIISNAGDEITLEFDASKLPKLPEGWKRDFLVRSVGWVKDGDLNTAYGHTVLPLPYHGMSSYPPSEKDIYPDDPILQEYNRKYNTRVITSEGYLEALKNGKN
ncbi:MAG: VCBS repeat-containing protein [Bacteroidales bacterium]|nr:VCBS repeat-containing protein [Bacteroidales bacterium]